MKDGEINIDMEKDGWLKVSFREEKEDMESMFHQEIGETW